MINETAHLWPEACEGTARAYVKFGQQNVQSPVNVSKMKTQFLLCSVVLLFNCANIVFLQHSSTCCTQYGLYYECRSCRSILFSTEREIYVNLLSSRTVCVKVLRGKIGLMRVKSAWQFSNLCTSNVEKIVMKNMAKSCGKYRMCFLLTKHMYLSVSVVITFFLIRWLFNYVCVIILELFKSKMEIFLIQFRLL